MAIYNRSLAYAAINEDEKAAEDLAAMLEMPGLPENIKSKAHQRRRGSGDATRIRRVRDRYTFVWVVHVVLPGGLISASYRNLPKLASTELPEGTQRLA